MDRGSDESPVQRASRRESLLAKERRLLQGGSHVAERMKSGAAGSVWYRLNAVDFMNSSLQFASLGVLCLFPFLLVVSAGTGHDLRKTVITRMGLDQLKDVGARIPIYVITFVIAVVFYTWTLHVLLMGRVRWSELLAGGLATAVCITGLAVFSSLLFSGQIVSSDNDYGPIGVVMILLSWLIGIGVCVHLGAVAGRAWNERGAPPTADERD